ncbi:arginine-tRNA-protein transferase [Chlamydoabsidia padenii]|nr:arginine-tRNA-protein transferase [Chlamydoabsidia padenii]
MAFKQQLSIVSIVGKSNNHCGYCDQDDTSYTYGLWAHALSCMDYQALLAKGWRRSGKYLYKPDLLKSCCPQYTIRLDATQFKPTKSQRKILNKVNRYIQGDWQPTSGDSAMVEESSSVSKKPLKKKETNKEQTLIETIHVAEQDTDGKEHSFKIVLEPSSYTEEKFNLYRKYQQEIHHDEPSEVTEKGFRRFLVDSPLDQETGDKVKYGSYHQKYILDGTLIAVAVLDILPHCVSSVYFMYDPDYAFLGLGNYSALREISLTQEYHASADDLKYYYMGFYIHSCTKMKYKAKYHPSELLDPESYDWYSFVDTCQPLLDQYKYAVFSNPVKSSTPISDNTLPSGWMDPTLIRKKDLEQVLILAGNSQVVPVTLLVKYEESKEFRDEIKDYVASIGLELAHRMILA